MSKPTKTKKNKVPKITEAEYAAYISGLKNECAPQPAPSDKEQKGETMRLR